MTTFTLKVCQNKGNARIWIQGKRLVECGLTRGVQLFRTMTADGQLILSTRPSDEAKKKHSISGKPSGDPVLDMTGKWVTEFVGDHSHYTVTIMKYHDLAGLGSNFATVKLVITPSNG